ncbi:MAG: thioredoxin domain-containing protein [Actinomycetota bacterium]
MNRLADETSPYLRQHEANPVDWYPWGDEAFAAARERNVPILLSVGYSACHWCHVMAHECFEDDDVAARMNELYVNVKVDREERPDVDQLYMDAVQAMTGRGGWPMTAFLTPQGEPFYGGTYYPREQFLQLLDAIDDVWRNRPDDVRQNVDSLTTAVSASSSLTPADDAPTLEQLNETVKALGRAHDPEWGGFGKPPKFPSTFNIELMLRAYMSSGSEPARDIITRTLDAMASGGIYDHLGGGFARYSTDREWIVPHFEKMLYDQASLVQIYVRGLLVLRQPQWRQIVQETVEYVLRTLTHPDGGFFSSEDADSLGPDGTPVEGWFYTWTPDEIRSALANVKPEVIEATLDWWGVDPDAEPNFEGRWILQRADHRGELARDPAIEFARARLLAARQQRPRPGLDDKVLLEWNALFLSALGQAAAVFGHRPWLDAAVRNAEFLLREMRGDDGRWFRSWHADGAPKARHAALAADHAALVDAFTRLAEASGQARWIDEARAVADTMLDWFFDPVDGGLWTSAEDAEHLVVRQKDLIDNAVPSANSQAAMALQRLAALTGEQRYTNQADRILQLLASKVDDGVGSYSNALLATDLRRRGITEVAVVPPDDVDDAQMGPWRDPDPDGAADRDPTSPSAERVALLDEAAKMVRFAHSIHRPDVVLAWGERYDSPLWESREPGHAYVCRDHVCEKPVTTVAELGEQLVGRKVTLQPPSTDPAG